MAVESLKTARQETAAQATMDILGRGALSHAFVVIVVLLVVFIADTMVVTRMCVVGMCVERAVVPADEARMVATAEAPLPFCAHGCDEGERVKKISGLGCMRVVLRWCLGLCGIYRFSICDCYGCGWCGVRRLSFADACWGMCLAACFVTCNRDARMFGECSTMNGVCKCLWLLKAVHR